MTKTCEPQEGWDNFWKDILVLPDGSIDVEQLKKELADFSQLIRNVPEIYMTATGGMISNPLTTQDAVLSVIGDYLSETYDEGYEEGYKQAREEFE